MDDCRASVGVRLPAASDDLAAPLAVVYRAWQSEARAGKIRLSSGHDGVRATASRGGGCVVKLISFDIDGTLEVGDPPGLITMDMVRQAKLRGCLIGSCSDRLLSDQQRLWETHHIIVDFTVLKHRLAEVRAQFWADIYYHIGDTDLDRFFAEQAGVRFVKADASVRQAWSPEMVL
jgi:hypothetical protein